MFDVDGCDQKFVFSPKYRRFDNSPLEEMSVLMFSPKMSAIVEGLKG